MDNQHTEYKVIEGTFNVEEKEYIGYGVSVNNTTSNEILLFQDISLNKEDIIKLVSLCNELNLDPIHINDVIDDFLATL